MEREEVPRDKRKLLWSFEDFGLERKGVESSATGHSDDIEEDEEELSLSVEFAILRLG